jgi:hypothetical protein
LDEEIHARYKDEKLDLVYLETLEKEYGMPNLWAYVAVDRVLMSSQLVREYPYDKPLMTHEEMLRVLQVTAKAVIEFLETEKPDALICSLALGGVGSLLLYSIAKKKGIPVHIIAMTGMKDIYLLSSHYTYLPEVEKKLKLELQKDPSTIDLTRARKILSDFRNQPEPYYSALKPSSQQVTRFKQLTFLHPKKLWRSVAWFVELLRLHFTSGEKNDYSYITPLHYFIDHAKRKLRNLRGVKDLYDATDPTDTYAFFPLQTEPEISLLLWAPYKTDQINAIKQAAKSLPIGYWLYVKEHPLMVAYRPREFYETIKKIPNVKLIDPAISGYQLLKNTKLVITITGTLGWEASMLKIPVVSMGDIYYNCLSFVKNCRAYEDLPFMVQEQLNNFTYNENELLTYMACILEESAELNYPYLWEQETDVGKRRLGLTPLADLIAKKLNLTKI